MKYIILEEKKKIAIAYTTSNIEQILNIHSTYNVGDIYIGVVESMLENLDIAFIKLDEWRENGFMVLKNEFFFYA
jgi:Ribonuclease G/E